MSFVNHTGHEFYALHTQRIASVARIKNVDHALCFAVFIINILAALARFRSYESHVGAKIALRKGKRTEEENTVSKSSSKKKSTASTSKTTTKATASKNRLYRQQIIPHRARRQHHQNGLNAPQ